MALQWLSADLLTGRVIAALPGVDTGTGTVNRTVSNVESVQATLALDDKTPENWNRATLPLAAVLAVYDGDDQALTKPPAWVGYVNSRDRVGSTNTVELGLSTSEGLFEKAYVGDTTYDPTWHRDDIIADLITTWFTPETGIQMGLRYTVGAGPSPTVPIVINNTDESTVKTVMDEVFAQLGGEYTVQWAFTDSGRTLAATLVFGTRIGQAAVGAAPVVTFELPGVLVDIEVTEDYSTGAYANKVTGYSSGQGDSTPFAAVATTPAAGRPVVEYRYSPSQSISPGALAQYVGQALSVLANGAQPIVLSYHTDRDKGRVYGLDWFLGDDIGYHVSAEYVNEQGVTVRLFAFWPEGLDGIGRAVGVQVDVNNSIIRPILADKAVYTGQVVPS